MTIMLRKVADLREGDRLDLEGDPYADPDCDNIALENEYQRVYSVSEETTPGLSLVICDDFACGFFSDYHVKVDVCDWGATNAFVDCGGLAENVPGDDGASLGTFCEVHADCVESDGAPEWLAPELAGMRYEPNTVGRVAVIAAMALEGWFFPRAEFTVHDSKRLTVFGGQVTIGWFATENEAATFISTLPEYETGRYSLDGPNEDGENVPA